MNGEHLYAKIVTPSGELLNPESCWIVPITSSEEKELAADLKGPRPLGDVIADYDGEWLKPNLNPRWTAVPVQPRKDTA